jgi:LysM repeat protein
MVRRSRARYLAPLALAAAITGTYLIVHDALINKPAAPPSHVTTQSPQGRRGKPRTRFYVVRRGDTLSSISQKTGVSIQTIQALNRRVIDPNSLQPGQRLRLRR